MDATERDIGRIEGMINGMNKSIERIEKQNGQILEKIGTMQLSCVKTVETFHNLAEQEDQRLSKLEEQDALGGMTGDEKAGLVGVILFTLYGIVKIVAKFVGIELP